MMGNSSCGLSVTMKPESKPMPAMAATKPRSNSRLRSQPGDGNVALAVVTDMANSLAQARLPNP